MTGESDWVDRVVKEHDAGRPLALMFDYDGTLTPVVAHPSLAALPPATREILAGLTGVPGVTVGVLSGRALAHIKELVGLPNVNYAGSSGMALDLDGEVVTDVSAAAFDALAEPILVALSEPIRWFPGTWVERKPGCLSVHYRELGPLKSACFREEIRDTLAFLAEDAPPLRVRDVTQALEISLAGAWSKGEAVERMLARWSRNAFPLYACDGENDTEAVDRVNSRGGLTIGIGADAPTAVAVRVPTPAEFAAHLDRLLTGLTRDKWSGVPERAYDHPIPADPSVRILPRSQ
jgi:trehalose 6-phosphate phosphatase